jgi:CBS domain-containing protein
LLPGAGSGLNYPRRVRSTFYQAGIRSADEKEARMIVNEIMTRDVQIISPEDSLQTAAQMMAVYDFGMVPVGENDRLIGMLTDRDITTRAVARGLHPAQCKVGDIMSPEVNYVFDYETVDAAARSMSNLQVRRLPVLNRDKRLVGIISLGDLAVTEPEPAADALTSISQPETFETRP